MGSGGKRRGAADAKPDYKGCGEGVGAETEEDQGAGLGVEGKPAKAVRAGLGREVGVAGIRGRRRRADGGWSEDRAGTKGANVSARVHCFNAEWTYRGLCAERSKKATGSGGPDGQCYVRHSRARDRTGDIDRWHGDSRKTG